MFQTKIKGPPPSDCCLEYCVTLPGGDELDEGLDPLVLLGRQVDLVEGGRQVGQGAAAKADAGGGGAGAQARVRHGRRLVVRDQLAHA